ncbi:MAG: Rne/Rng family ribonuclease [Candidatus Acidiferrales bacterium]
MPKEMVISANPHETRVAILEEGQLCEYYVERQKEFALVGSIYKGRVTRVLPGMQSAFVEIGLDSDAFLYVSDFLEDTEEFDQVVSPVVAKVEKIEEPSGEVFPAGIPPGQVAEPVDVEATLASGIMPAAETPRGVSEGAPAPPAHGVFVPDRPRYEGRHRESRDLVRRGGRHGRFGKHGGRSGDRPHSRDLPASKYASPRIHEEHSAESVPAEGNTPIILPGESLAKYRDRTPSASPPVLTKTEEPVTPKVFDTVPKVQNTDAPPAPPQPRPAFSESSFGGLAPLPGETLSKWNRPQVSTEQPVESSASHEMGDVMSSEAVSGREDLSRDALEEQDQEQEAHRLHEAEAADEEHIAAELSEDEAAALAEHVAEAQIDEEAREAQRREFAAADEDAMEAVETAFGEEVISEDLAEQEEAPVADTAQDAAEDAAGSETESDMSLPLPEEASLAELAREALPGGTESAISAEGSSPQNQQPWNARIRNDSRSRMQHPARRGRDRGRRTQHGPSGHGHGHRPQPRRPQLISDLLKQGQEIIVQIAKEPLGKKGARITSHVALPGRYLVYMPTLDHTGVSRKIASAEDRARLRHLVNEAKGAAGGGFIVRTAAASAAPEEVRADVEFLTKTWAEIKTRSEQRKAPSLLHRDLNLVERILRDYMAGDYAAIWVDSEEEFTKVVDFMSRFQPALASRVKLYTKETPIFEEFGIQQEIDKGLRPKVWLKSGGYIVINHTEALVAIDVNTGKFVGKGSTRLEDTIVRTNVEAVKEIVRQMRLRDLGGIIIIDFIDMEERRNREKVMAALEDALRADRAPSKMLRFNEFGLIAITRKRTKQALERTLCQPCPYCTGSGMVKSIPTLCYEIQTEARKMATEIEPGSLTLRVHPEISKAFKTRESSLIEELEHWTKKSVIIQADPTLHWEQYDIY